MASYNPSNQTDFQYNQTNIQNKGLFSRMLRNIQNWGQNYDDMVIRNQYSVGINEDPMMINSGLYDLFSQRSVANVLGKKSIPYLDKGYADKKRILREYSVKDEIRDFVSTISDESIVYDDSGKDFCHPSPLSSDYPQDVVDKYQEYFEKIYNKYGFSDSISAWNLMRDFLIDGFVCMEIVYDDKSKEIIGFVRMKPETVVPAFEPSIGSIWIQYPEDPQNRRIFLDSQIIYISYSIQNDYTEISSEVIPESYEPAHQTEIESESVKSGLSGNPLQDIQNGKEKAQANNDPKDNPMLTKPTSTIGETH